MIINKSGIVIRIAVEGLRVMGRATQGVRLINLKDTDAIASITKVEREEEVEGVELDEDGNPIIAAESTEEPNNESDQTENETE